MAPPRFDPRPVTLRGNRVLLEPLDERHAADLFAAARDEATWLYMPLPEPESVDDVRAMIRDAVDGTAAGGEVAFAVVLRPEDRAVGSTRFIDLQRPHRGLEIGWTWIGPAWRRTSVNTECKLLLLTHAFEDLGAHRVTFKTDARNETSQRALARLGAVREGTLRRHRVCWDGHVRDSVYFGVTDADWPEVKRRLAAMAAPR